VIQEHPCNFMKIQENPGNTREIQENQGKSRKIKENPRNPLGTFVVNVLLKAVFLLILL
jgi:hypothetical protein